MLEIEACPLFYCASKVLYSSIPGYPEQARDPGFQACPRPSVDFIKLLSPSTLHFTAYYSPPVHALTTPSPTMPDDKKLADIYLQEIANGPPEFSNYWDDPRHDWGYTKFEYLPDDLFTELQWKCGNNILLPLLTRGSFLSIAADIAKVAQDRAAFEALLTKRMDKERQDKVNELLRPWNTFEILDYTPPKHKHWEIVDHMFKEKSFQTIVDFVLGILKDRDYFPEEASVPPSLYPSASDFEDDFEDSDVPEHPPTKASPPPRSQTGTGLNDCASTAPQTRKRPYLFHRAFPTTAWARRDLPRRYVSIPTKFTTTK